MDNYEYSPQKLKIPITIGDNSITVHNIGIYYHEIEKDCEILMCGVTLKS